MRRKSVLQGYRKSQKGKVPSWQKRSENTGSTEVGKRIRRGNTLSKKEHKRETTADERAAERIKRHGSSLPKQ